MPPGGRLHHHHREHDRVRDDEHGSVYHGQHDVQQDGEDNVQQVKWQITKTEWKSLHYLAVFLIIVDMRIKLSFRTMNQ